MRDMESPLRRAFFRPRFFVMANGPQKSRIVMAALNN
jgi:hypothetical protein